MPTKRRVKSSSSYRRSSTTDFTKSTLVRVLAKVIPVVIIFFVGLAIIQKMPNNSRATPQDQCKNELARVTKAKRQINYITDKLGEEVDDKTQKEFDESYKAYLDCKAITKQNENQNIYGEFGTDTPVACGKWGCHNDETCIKTENAKTNNNGGYECVPSRCLTNSVVNPSLSYCDTNQNLINCREFLNSGGIQGFSCSSRNMTCTDDGAGKASCKATPNNTSDCRVNTNPNSNCDASSFCNLQTGRCVRSSNVDGSIIDAKKAACTSTYIKYGCAGEGSEQTCTRYWDDAQDVCVNTGCNRCQL